MSLTETSNIKRRRASRTNREELTAIRARTTVFMTVASLSGFESLVDDTHDLILQFVGKRSYGSYGSINKRCREIFLSKNLPKETFLYGYAPLSTIKEKYKRYHHAVGQAIVGYNRNDILQWLVLEKNKRDIRETFDNAAGVSLKSLKRVLNDVGDDAFISMKINKDWNVSDEAARGGRLDVLKWLKTKGWFETDDYELFSSAAEGGNVNMLEFLKENKCPLDPEECMLSAANGGSLESIQWLLRNGCSFDHVNEEVVKEAARKGRLHVLEFFIENGLSINDIGENESIDNLQWLLDNNFPWYKKCYSEAAKSNNLEVLEWLKEKGCPRGDSVLAVGNFSSEAKDWLSENGFTTVHLRRRMFVRKSAAFEGPWSSSWNTT